MVDDKTVVFTVEKGSSAQPQHRTTLTLDTETGEIIRAEKFEDQDPGL